MDRADGIAVLSRRGWLKGAPVDFQTAVLSGCRWHSLTAGTPITVAGDEAADLIGLARGAVEMTTAFGVAATPLMHIAHPGSWMGYGPIITGQPRALTTTARSLVWLASVRQSYLLRLLSDRPEWWRYLAQLALIYGDTSANIAADLLIRDSGRRLAAVLLRLSGRRFAGAEDADRVEISITQDELAAASNLSRNTAGSVIRKLAALGLIENAYRGVVVQAPVDLRAYVDRG